MRATIKKWGNSASVRIPSALLQAAHFDVNQVVEIHEEDGRLIIEPLQEDDTCLADLLSKITDENLHKEESFGKAAGQEIW